MSDWFLNAPLKDMELKFLLETNYTKDQDRNVDQVYSNTRVPTQVNTNQHESTRINTSPTRINTSPTRINTSQHESVRP